MKRIYLILLFSALANQLVSQKKFGEFISYYGSIQASIADNIQYGTKTRPNRIHIGLEVGGGMSVSKRFNLLLGLGFMQMKPNNTRSDYTICDGSPSCIPITVSNQLFLPFGFEYYLNTDRSPFQSFYSIKLVPSFSVTEKTEIIPFDADHAALPAIVKKNNGFKFQDFHFQIAINNEIGINQDYKIFIEPSASHSLLFRKEDFVNPDYMISLKIGFRFRGEKKND